MVCRYYCWLFITKPWSKLNLYLPCRLATIAKYLQCFSMPAPEWLITVESNVNQRSRSVMIVCKHISRVSVNRIPDIPIASVLFHICRASVNWLPDVSKASVLFLHNRKSMTQSDISDISPYCYSVNTKCSGPWLGLQENTETAFYSSCYDSNL